MAARARASRGSGDAVGKELFVTVVRIAVVDPLPLYQRGVVTVLAAAGHEVETPVDLVAWVREPGDAIVLLTVASENDWQVLHGLCGVSGKHVVVAVVDGASDAAGARAVRVGARSVVPREAEADLLRQTVAATVRGQAVMPAGVAVLLASGSRREGPRPASDEEVDWLKQLATGMTVVQVANQAGYSERAMFRLLSRVYRRMGARTRLEAIMLARQSGWL
ncbi:MAG: DNA-binding response regulator [Actinomycetota bacterium]|nr:DNA-binding response regulator [Actinomycetota bacterium]